MSYSSHPNLMDTDRVDHMRQSFAALAIESDESASAESDNTKQVHQPSKETTVQAGKSVARSAGRPSQRPAPQLGRSPSVPKDYLQLPPLPPDASSGDRFYAFGWPLEDHVTVLTEIAVRLWSNSMPGSGMGLSALMLHSGYRVHLFPTPWEKGDKVATFKYRNGKVANAPCKWMVAITYTASNILYNRRPSVEVYNWLNEQLPGEPRWLPDYFPKDEWRRHNISLAGVFNSSFR